MVLIILFILFLLPSNASYCADATVPLTVTRMQMLANYAKLQKQMDQLLKFRCTDQETAQKLKKTNTAIGESQSSIDGIVNSYLAVVSTSIKGEGDCKASFLAVSRESDSRAKFTKETKAKLKEASQSFAIIAQDNFYEGSLTFDGAQDKNCATSALRQYEKTEAEFDAVGENHIQLQLSIDYEYERFRKYQEENLRMASNCESSGSNTRVLSSSNPINADRVPASVNSTDESGLNSGGSGISKSRSETFTIPGQVKPQIFEPGFGGLVPESNVPSKK